jgi:hypothetical protein
MARQDRDSQYGSGSYGSYNSSSTNNSGRTQSYAVEIIIEKIIGILQPLKQQQKKLQQFLKQIK